MTKQELLLLLVMEECQEISQRASKALRFGLDEVQDDPAQNPFKLNNLERLLDEYNDLVGAMGYLQLQGILPEQILCPIKIGNKLEKIEKYLKYSQELKTVSN